MADYTLLDLIPAFSEIEHCHGWGEYLWNTHPLFQPKGPISAVHVAFSLFVLKLIIALCTLARIRYRSREEALIPDGRFSVRDTFEVLFDAVFNMMAGMMGPSYAKKFFPLIAALGVYILLCNLMGLIPGFVPPTQNMNTNVAMSLVVFVFYNYVGIREQGLAYLKHFMGPMARVAPLSFMIEIFGHAFRPVSLAVRLAVNMTGDHAVLGVFCQIAADVLGGFPLFLPIPFLFLGLLVSVVQTIVFCMLSSIYIAMAVHHEGEH